MRRNFHIRAKRILLIVPALFLLPGFCSAQFLFFDATDSAKIDQQSAGTDNVGPGVIVLDVDNDGWDDLYLPGGADQDKLYRNNHDGTFTDIADSNFSNHYFRVYPRGGTAFDFDNDGFTDLYLCTQGNPIFWKNTGNGKFLDYTDSAGLSTNSLEQNQSNGATFGDFNGDGYNDLYVARWVDEFKSDTSNGVFGYANKGFPNWFYVNNGNGTFTERAKEFGVDGDTGCSNIALFFDYDRDGDLDLLIGNDFGVEEMPNRVFKNMLMETGKATFVPVDSIGLDQHLFCMGICPNDYNRDGQFDFYETTAGGDVLMQNNNNIFSNVSTQTRLPDGHVHGDKDTVTISWTPLLADFDNDGWEDAFIAHGFIGIRPPWLGSRTDTSVFLHNNGGSFEDVTEQTGIIFNLRCKGAALIDYDHDGKVDIAIGSQSLSGTRSKDFRIFHNITSDENTGHWMQIKFTAKRTAKEAVGTIADIWTQGIVHSRQISTGGGQCSCGPLTAFVGLGHYTQADSIVVFWPADKNLHRQIDRYYNVPANRMYHITENMGTAPNPSLLTFEGVATSSPPQSVSLYPNPAKEVLHITDDLPLLAEKHFEIYDLLGIKQLNFTGTENTLSVSLNSLKPGCYALHVTGNGKVITKQFIKE